MQRYMGNHIRIIQGKSGYALYDLYKGNVYHLNNEAYNVIQRYLFGENKFDEDEQVIIDTLDEIEFTIDLIEECMTDVSPKLSYVWLEITEACNLNCIHCYGEWGHRLCESENYLTCSEWKNVIDIIYDLGCRKIQFIGGEPLASSDFYELITYAHKKPMKQIDVFTNGTLINDKLINMFKEVGANIRVSIYGHNSDVHDGITGCKGSFDKTVCNVKKMQEIGIPVNIAVVLMHENEKYATEIEAFISSFGSHGYDTIRQTTFGTQHKHSIKNVKILSDRYQLKPDFSVKMKEFDYNKKWNNCWFGKVAITSKGDIIPCIFARECIMGNIKNDSIDTITANVLDMWGISKDKVDECKICEYRYACHDCRPLAKGLTGNLLAKYPRCCYNPQSGEWSDIEKISLELSNSNE